MADEQVFEAFGTTFNAVPGSQDYHAKAAPFLHDDITKLMEGSDEFNSVDERKIHCAYESNGKMMTLKGNELEFDHNKTYVNLKVGFSEFVHFFLLWRKTENGEKLAGSYARDVDETNAKKVLGNEYEKVKDSYFQIFETLFSIEVPKDKATYYVFNYVSYLFYIRRKSCNEKLFSDYFLNMFGAEDEQKVFYHINVGVLSKTYPSS